MPSQVTDADEIPEGQNKNFETDSACVSRRTNSNRNDDEIASTSGFVEGIQNDNFIQTDDNRATTSRFLHRDHDKPHQNVGDENTPPTSATMNKNREDMHVKKKIRIEDLRCVLYRNVEIETRK